MASSLLLNRLIKALEIQPGVGVRSATRIAFYLLDRRREDAKALASILSLAMEHIGQCPLCRDYSDDNQICPICASEKRRQSGLLCIVETPLQVQAIEESESFFGQYFILHGHLSPIDGIGPQEIGLDALETRLKSGEIKEVILATNPTVEGEATASYIGSIAKHLGLSVSKIAQGVPIGGDLDNIDSHTLMASLKNRKPL